MFSNKDYHKKTIIFPSWYIFGWVFTTHYKDKRMLNWKWKALPKAPTTACEMILSWLFIWRPFTDQRNIFNGGMSRDSSISISDRNNVHSRKEAGTLVFRRNQPFPVAKPYCSCLTGILNMQTVTKPALHDCDARNGVSPAEQNAVVILHPLRPRNGGCERERRFRSGRPADVSIMSSHREKLSCMSPDISQLPASLLCGGLPTPTSRSIMAELDGLSSPPRS